MFLNLSMSFSIMAFVFAVGISADSPAADGTHPSEPRKKLSIDVVDSPPTDQRSDLYVGNREPLSATPLIRLPVGCIQPRGWLQKQLELQAAGFNGHLHAISQFLQKDGNAWLAKNGIGDHGWEEPPYWLKGFANLAYLLGDERLLREARIWIEGALESQKPDGWFGPDGERTGRATKLVGRDDLWPNTIMLFCLQDYYDYSSDQRVIDLMTRYFDYLINIPEDKFLVGYWPRMRGGDLLLSVYWLYNRTGDDRLLQLAEKVHRRTAPWSDGLINRHNVNIAQGFREPATYSMQSQYPKHRQASYAVYDEVRQTYGQVPGGMFGGDENCRPGHRDPRQAVETCGMAEMMFSTETLTWITGDLVWADRCEDVAYNSLPAALMPDLKALRYLTAPNMPLSDAASKKPGLQNGGPMLLMSPHIHRCCQHNWGQAWPYFAQHAWFATSDHGLAAIHPVAAVVKAKVADGDTVSIRVNTKYPFEAVVRLRVTCDKPLTFPLYLRIPGWCGRVAARVNDDEMALESASGKFARIEREWNDGDEVELHLPMDIVVRRWPENGNSASVSRGPLTYSLAIGEDVRRAGGSDEWPEYEIHPTTEWNFGLELSDAETADFEVVERQWPRDNQPFAAASVPVEIRAPAKPIPQWQLDEHGLADELPKSPVSTDEPGQTVRLIPMGAARLRISAFPVVEGN